MLRLTHPLTIHKSSLGEINFINKYLQQLSHSYITCFLPLICAINWWSCEGILVDGFGDVYFSENGSSPWIILKRQVGLFIDSVDCFSEQFVLRYFYKVKYVSEL